VNDGCITAFAPATVSNVACGFDIFGFALEKPGDYVEARLRAEPGVAIEEITGDRGKLPRGADHNTATVAVRALLAESRVTAGISLSLHKRMPISSGMGSSAASSVAALLAANELLGINATREVLLRCAMEGERAATGSPHPDNAAPSLYGGFVLVRGGQPPEVTPLPIPRGLACAVIHPDIEIDTRSARAALGDSVPLKDAVTQWGNVAGLVAGLYEADHALIGRCLTDVIAEPCRAAKVPAFDKMKQAALETGALGCSLSGSGPAVFALTRTRKEAGNTGEAMQRAFQAHSGGLECSLYLSGLKGEGARIVSAEDIPCDT